MSAAIELHLTIEQLAAIWQLSPDFLRDVFAREPGVLRAASAPGKRQYLRIPLSVANRVHARLSGVQPEIELANRAVKPPLEGSDKGRIMTLRGLNRRVPEK